MATLAELTQRIQDYAEYTETSFVTNIPVFIQAAEERIFYLCQLPFFKETTTLAGTASVRVLTVPTNFKSPLSLSYQDTSGVYDYLEFRDETFLREIYPDDTAEGAPRFYALQDEATIALGPVPDQDYTFTLYYTYEPVSLVTDTDGTWLSENAYEALFYGSLVEAYNYMKGDADMLAECKEQFSLGIIRLQNLGEARDRKDIYRDGELRKAEA